MPYVEVWVDVDLSDEDDEDLISELEGRGYTVQKLDGYNMIGLAAVEHLLDCGMVEYARLEALRIVGNSLGRKL